MSAKQPPGFDSSEFDAIEAAVMETVRGRWFLSEFAKRNRAAQTDTVLEAIRQLEAVLHRDRAVPRRIRVRDELKDLSAAVNRTRREFANLHADPSGQSDAGATPAHRTAQTILSSVEKIQQSTWALRQRGADPGLCEALDAYSTEIYGACAAYEENTRRIARAIGLLNYLADRLSTIAALVDSARPEDPGPQDVPASDPEGRDGRSNLARDSLAEKLGVTPRPERA